MNREQEEEILRALETRDIHVAREEDWTPQHALDVLRENRRRYARDEGMQALAHLAKVFAEGLTEQTGVSAADVSAVLLRVSAKLAGAVIVGNLSAKNSCELLGFVADDLDRQAKADPDKDGTP